MGAFALVIVSNFVLFGCRLLEACSFLKKQRESGSGGEGGICVGARRSGGKENCGWDGLY